MLPLELCSVGEGSQVCQAIFEKSKAIDIFQMWSKLSLVLQLMSLVIEIVCLLHCRSNKSHLFGCDPFQIYFELVSHGIKWLSFFNAEKWSLLHKWGCSLWGDYPVWLWYWLFVVWHHLKWTYSSSWEGCTCTTSFPCQSCSMADTIYHESVFLKMPTQIMHIRYSNWSSCVFAEERFSCILSLNYRTLS